MNRQLLTILIGLFLTSNLLGQVQNDVKQVLALKDFVTFKKYADNLSNRENRIHSHWKCLRDLTTDFQEGVFYFDRSIPDKDNPEIYSDYTFLVTIITTKTDIVYYELAEMKYKKDGNIWVSYNELIDTFKDDKAFDSLKVSFKNIYNTELNEDELFITDFAYGFNCSFGGVKSKNRDQINEWVSSNNKTELIEWLKSTNTEKQVYAIDGLYQLKQIGINLTNEEVEMINAARRKKGTMLTCNDDIQLIQEIGRMTKKFTF